MSSLADRHATSHADLPPNHYNTTNSQYYCIRMHNSKAVGKGPIVAMSFQWSTRLELVRFDSIRFDSIRFGFVSQVGGATLRIEIGGGGRKGI